MTPGKMQHMMQEKYLLIQDVKWNIPTEKKFFIHVQCLKLKFQFFPQSHLGVCVRWLQNMKWSTMNF